MPETSIWLIPEDVHKEVIHGITDQFGFSKALSYELDENGLFYARYGKGIDPRDSFYYNGRVPGSGELFDIAIKDKKELIIWDSGSFARDGISKEENLIQ